MTRKRMALTTAVVLAAASAGALVATATAHQPAAAAQDPPPNTATVQRGTLSAIVSQYGTLTYAAQPDGSPYQVINQASGTYTALPTAGEKVGCGDVLYRVDDRPVLLLCGSTPAYRALSPGDSGRDVAQLNANLVQLGYASHAQLDPSSATFSAATSAALGKLQAKLGEPSTGSLTLGQAVFLPTPARVAAVTGQLGGPAHAGTPVLTATSDTPVVQVGLDPTYQYTVKQGDRAQVTLPNHTIISGRVTRVGVATEAPASQNGQGGGGQTGNQSVTVPVTISLDHPAEARGFDQAPVQVQITTRGVQKALSVPVTAIVAQTGGGFAVEVVRADGQRDLVAVTLGLVDDAAGRVQVHGALQQGDHVVVPST